MNWIIALAGLTAMEAGIAVYIYISYHGDPSVSKHFPDMTPQSMARLVVMMQGINLILLGLVDKFSSSLGGLFLGTGGAGANLYSRERGMARNGERDEACQRLAKAVARKGDLAALRLLIEVATQEPRLHLWVSKAAGLRGKVKKMSREDLAGLDMMLGRTVKVEKKEEPAFF